MSHLCRCYAASVPAIDEASASFDKQGALNAYYGRGRTAATGLSDWGSQMILFLNALAVLAESMRRQPSVTGLEDIENRNTAWLNERGGWLIFIVCLSLMWVVLWAFSLPAYVIWSAITLIHGFLTLYFMHFRLGSPFGGFFGDDGRFDSLTWWEQIDNGEQHTSNRKFLTIVPLLLLIVTFKVTSDAGAYNCLASSVFLSSILLIAKTPLMYRKRLFGLNSPQNQDSFLEISPRAGEQQRTGSKSKRT